MVAARLKARIGWVLAVLGVMLAMAGLSLRPFATRANALMGDKLTGRFLSVLYDHGALNPEPTQGWIVWSPGNSVEVQNYGRGEPFGDAVWPITMAILYHRRTDVEPPGRPEPAEEARPNLVHIGDSAVLCLPGETAQLASMFQGFDLADYPVNPKALALALRKDAMDEYAWNRALSAYHKLTQAKAAASPWLQPRG